MTAPAQVLAAVRSIPHPRQEPDMTAPEPSPAEQAVIDRSGIYEAEEKVEKVARALCDGDAEDHGTYTWDEAAERSEELCDDYRRAARHAIAALPASPAEEALRRVEAIAQRMRQDGIDSYAGDGEDDEIVRARAVALYYAADELLAAPH